jgi:hypothetical protein
MFSFFNFFKNALTIAIFVIMFLFFTKILKT